MIACIGLGLIGEPVAAHLLRAGFAVGTAVHRSRSAVDRLAALGATTYPDLRSLITAAERVIIAVPDGPAVESVFAAGLPPSGTTVIDLSTISIGESLSINRRLAAQGVRYIDAPVSGGHEGAVAGSLTVLCGATVPEVDELLPLLNHFAKSVVPCGARGLGLAIKLANNLLGGVQMAAIGEALAITRGHGLDDRMVIEAIMASSGGSTILRGRTESIINDDFDPRFALALMHKDLHLAADALQELGAAHPVVRAAITVYERFMGSAADRDFAVVSNAGKDRG